MSGPAPDAEWLATLRAVAETAARAGGAVARDAFARPPGVRLKSDASVVTDADVAAQAAVIAAIRAARPADVCIGEEGDGESRSHGSPRSAAPQRSTTSEPGMRQLEAPAQCRGSNVVWLIDPIDGTRNFVRGSPAFACSVGALCDGVPVAGAIYEPLRDAMYAADLSAGLFVSGVRRFPQAAADRGPSGPADELVVSLPSTATPPVAAIMHACVDRCVIRNVGSAALHLAMLATGELDAAVMATCKLWDLAAGAALVAAVGGVCVALDGGPLFPIEVQRRAATELPCIVARERAVAERLLDLTTTDRFAGERRGVRAAEPSRHRRRR